MIKKTRISHLLLALTVAAWLPPARGATGAEEEQTSGGGSPVVATLVTIMNVPARAMVCSLSGWLASIVMVASGGQRYTDAGRMMEEGCSGPWIITPDMIIEPRPTSFGVAREEKQRPAALAELEPPAVAREPAPSSALEALRRGEVEAEGPLKNIYFDFDRYELRPDAQETLKANAEWLKANPSARVEIEGHCDERGTNEYNLALGTRRAQAAKDYLVGRGISVERLFIISYGEELPVCRESNEECWQRNRRARFVILPERPAS